MRWEPVDSGSPACGLAAAELGNLKQWRWQNLTNQPFEALKEPILLREAANYRICF